MRDLPPADLEWISRAPQQVKVTTYLDATPAQVFAAFADAATWPQWFPMMKSATYLDRAGGLGKERDVALRALGVFRERFIAWDDPSHFAFTAVATTSPLLAKFAEDYRLTRDGSRTRFDWHMGAELRSVGKPGAPVLRVIMKKLIARAGTNLSRRLARA